MKIAYFFALLLWPFIAFAENNVVNIYGWNAQIPPAAIHQFEKETGIKVNLSTYENNEIMYTKLRATPAPGYDIIMPSSYYVDRMAQQGMLEKLDKSKLSNWKNLNPVLLHPAYDPNSDYSLPGQWGITGIFVNDQYYSPKKINKWIELWGKQYQDQLVMLDDTREMFSMALLSLGYSANDHDPKHIEAAYLQLKKLMPNIKVFATDAVASILIDEDATIGMAWNGDTFKAMQDNKHIQFIFPQDGFVIWVDTFAIPKNAPHKEAAYLFLNFLLRPEIGKAMALYTMFPTGNLASQHLLPAEIRNNPAIYPPIEVMRHGQFQTNLNDDTLALYEKYWEQLKMSG